MLLDILLPDLYSFFVFFIIQVMNFVAQFRIVQRLIMLCTVIWIIVVMYKTGIIDSLKSQLTIAVGGVEESVTSPYHNVFNQSDTRLNDNIKGILRDGKMAHSVHSIVHHVSKQSKLFNQSNKATL